MNKIVPMQGEHLKVVARLHANALAGDFLPSLGERFLYVFYRSALLSGQACGFVSLDSEMALSGFVQASMDTSALFRNVFLRSALLLGWAALPALLKQPALLLNVAETFLYPSRERAGEKTELLVIAVEAAQRSQGLGEALVLTLDDYLRAQGIQAYKVTVLQSNPGANRFYQRLGFQLGEQFHLYGKGWNLYFRQLDCGQRDHQEMNFSSKGM